MPPKESDLRLVTLFGIVTVVRLLQLKNASLPILFRPSGSSISASSRQLPNELFPIVSRFFGSLTVLSPKHSLNALSPIAVTASGIVTDVSVLFPLNTSFPTAVTVLPSITLGITYAVTPELNFTLSTLTPVLFSEIPTTVAVTSSG